MASTEKKRKLSNYLENNKMWQTRDHTFLVSSILIFFLALFLLGVGLGMIQGSSSSDVSFSLQYLEETFGGQTSNYLSPTIHLYEEVELNIPTSNPDTPIPIKMDFILSSDSYFSQNTLFEVNLTASFSQKDMQVNGINIVQIRTQFLDAMEVTPNEFTPTGFTVYDYSKGEFYLQKQNIQEKQVWSKHDYFTFRQNGTIFCEINFSFDRYPTNNVLTEENHIYFNHSFSNFSINSYSELSEYQRVNLQSMADLRQQQLQVKLQALQTAMFQQAQANQERNEDLNLGFTFLVLFLAVLEISFKMFEYSKDKKLEKAYDYKKRYEKQKDVI